VSEGKGKDGYLTNIVVNWCADTDAQFGGCSNNQCRNAWWHYTVDDCRQTRCRGNGRTTAQLSRGS